ncbi:MAG: hypothetical protein LBU32_29930 [Clostridiales bacterium]|nr:hypothetical protein [Clostridiales bacterium]
MKKPGSFAFPCAASIKISSKRMVAGREGFRAGRCKCIPPIDPARRRAGTRFKWRAAFCSRQAGAPEASLPGFRECCWQCILKRGVYRGAVDPDGFEPNGVGGGGSREPPQGFVPRKRANRGATSMFVSWRTL